MRSAVPLLLLGFLLVPGTGNTALLLSSDQLALLAPLSEDELEPRSYPEASRSRSRSRDRGDTLDATATPDPMTALLWGLAPLNGAGSLYVGRPGLGYTLLGIQGGGLLLGLGLIVASRNNGDRVGPYSDIVTEDDFILALGGLSVIATTFLATYLVDAIATLMWVSQHRAR